jgi:hypothetical protein
MLANGASMMVESIDCIHETLAMEKKHLKIQESLIEK